jgi:hypothetical protein
VERLGFRAIRGSSSHRVPARTPLRLYRRRPPRALVPSQARRRASRQLGRRRAPPGTGCSPARRHLGWMLLCAPRPCLAASLLGPFPYSQAVFPRRAYLAQARSGGPGEQNHGAGQPGSRGANGTPIQIQEPVTGPPWSPPWFHRFAPGCSPMPRTIKLLF